MRHTPLRRLLCLALLLPAVGLASEEPKACPTDLETCVHAMVEKLRNRGWIGIELESDDEGRMRITGIVPGSPAAEVGLEAGDVLLSTEGIDHVEANREKLEETYRSFTPGRTISLVVRRGDRRVAFDLTLAALPEEVAASWIGHHVLAAHVRPDEP